MTENEKTELLIRMDERLKNMERVNNEILIEAKKTNGRVRDLETWKSQIVASVKTVSVLWGIGGALLGATATVITLIVKG